MSHRIEHREMQYRTVQRVVKAITGHFVRRLEQTSDGNPVGLQYERWQQIPLHAGSQRQGAAPPVKVVHVRGTSLGGDQVADEQAELDTTPNDLLGLRG